MNDLFLTGQDQRIAGAKTVIGKLLTLHHAQALPHPCGLEDGANRPKLLTVADESNAGQRLIGRASAHPILKDRIELRELVVRLCQMESGFCSALAQYYALDSAGLTLFVKLLWSGKGVQTLPLLEQRQNAFQAILTRAIDSELFAPDCFDVSLSEEMDAMPYVLEMLTLSDQECRAGYRVGRDKIKEMMEGLQRSVRSGNKSESVLQYLTRRAEETVHNLIQTAIGEPDVDFEADDSLERIESVLQAAAGLTELARYIADGFRQFSAEQVSVDVADAIELLAR